MKNKSLLYIILSVIYSSFVFLSCIDTFSPELSKSDLEPQLVIEGTITDEPGPFRVRLTKSGSVYTAQNVFRIEPVSGAAVHISDDEGHDFHLFQVTDGWYETLDTCLLGVSGVTYTLHVTDENGTEYESTPECMAAVPPIDSLFFEAKQITHIEGETVTREEWLDIFLNTHTPVDEIYYLKWRFDETWEFKMPEYIRVGNLGGDSRYCISQTTGAASFNTWVSIVPEQLHCWTTESSKAILIKSSSSSSDGEINRFPVTSIGPEDDRISIRYSILVKQYSLGEDLFDYFKILESLNETNGGIYDKIPSPVYGNIQTLSGDKKALGYFLVSAVSKKRLFIDPDEVNLKTGHKAYSACGWVYPPICFLPHFFYGTIIDGDVDLGAYVWSTDNFCTDCRKRGTSVKPDFWE
jgi:hypothetical protein